MYLTSEWGGRAGERTKRTKRTNERGKGGKNKRAATRGTVPRGDMKSGQGFSNKPSCRPTISPVQKIKRREHRCTLRAARARGLQ